MNMPRMNMLRIRALRKQVEAWTVFRDAMAETMDADDFVALGNAIAPPLDRTLHELARLEQGDAYAPYPHPIGSQWWKVDPEEA